MTTATAFLDTIAPGLLGALTEQMFPTLVEQFNARQSPDPVTVEDLVAWLEMPAVKAAKPKPRARAAASADGVQCAYVFSKGDHKGEQCQNNAQEGSDRCNSCGRKGSKVAKVAKPAVSAGSYVSGMPPRTPAGRAPTFASRAVSTPAAEAETKVAARPATRTVAARAVAPRPVARAVEAKAEAPAKPVETVHNMVAKIELALEQLPDGRFVHSESGFVFATADAKAPVVGRETKDQTKVEPLTAEDRAEATKLGFVLPVDAAARPRPAITRSIVTRKPEAPGGPTENTKAAEAPKAAEPAPKAEAS